MRAIPKLLFLISVILSLPALASATQIAAFVEPFAVAGNADPKLSGPLQTMLTTRLDPETVRVVDTIGSAQVRIKGNYIQFGKVFSIDVTARNGSGEIVAKAFEQGDGEEKLLAAVTALGTKISGQLAATNRIATAPQQSTPSQAVAPPAATVPPKTPEPKAGRSDIIKADAANPAASGSTSQRLAAAYGGMALLKTLPEGGREFAVFKERTLKVVRFSPKVATLAEVELKADEKIVAVDTFDIDGDGSRKIFLTVVRGDDPASQIWSFKEGKLNRVKENLPYYFRVVTESAGQTLYAQESGRSEDYYGPVYRFVKTAKGYGTENPLKLPKLANIYNFSRFRDSEGANLFVVLHQDGFLIVYDEGLNELWRSNDKFGGSEVFFRKDDSQYQRFSGDAFRKVFLQQRITATKDGDVLVPQNSGTWNIGNSRNYSKSSLYSFTWSGGSLQEKWHTTPAQTYLADYVIDSSKNEAVLLEVVQKAGITESGASVIGIRKIE